MAFSRALPAQQLPGRIRTRQRTPHSAGAWGWRKGQLRNLPAELWGAINALSYTLYPVPESSCRPVHGQARRPFVAAGAAASPTAAGTAALRANLDYRPSLSTWQKLSALLMSMLVCLAVYQVLPAMMAGWQLYLLLAALLFGLWRLLLVLHIEGKLQERMTSERELSDPDSQFAKVLGVDVHYKRKEGTRLAAEGKPPAFFVHCYHGFGANVFSWAMCQQELADEVNGVVTAHDSPGFGLTQRPIGLDAYTSSFNGQLGRMILDAQSTDLEDNKEAGEQAKKVLIGHSMGGAAAVEEVIRRPEGVDCVVLVSPAVVAFSPTPPPSPRSKTEAAAAIPRWRRWAAVVGNLFAALCSTAAGVVLLMLQPMLVWLLRALVRSRAFWERGLRSAWYDSRGVTSELVDAYRMPQLVKGWEGGILRFVRAKLAGAEGVMGRLRGATELAMLLTTAERFAVAVQRAGIRVLIVHGEADLLVPASNSRRLAAMVGANAQLVQVPRCGHQPQEELPGDFVRWVVDFLEADADRPCAANRVTTS
mmetsp:Transcript_7462/g.21080  ORF Transcript_7462/g.21080 Transcript_7462/m.21080 type:complete len:535 (-) Transcript_7462:143-1747(-)